MTDLKNGGDAAMEHARTNDNPGADSVPKTTYKAGEYFHDALCLNEFNLSDYLQAKTVSLGKSKKDKDWQPYPISLETFLKKLAEHRIGEKDGGAFVPGELVRGERTIKAVKSLDMLVFDIDDGTPTEDLVAMQEKFGFFSLLYTSHSHLKTKTDLPRDNIFAALPHHQEMNTEAVREYCGTKLRWKSYLIPTIEYVGEDHNDKGPVALIRHAPIPKHRLVIPLNAPFVVAREGKTIMLAKQKWKGHMEALANQLGLTFDPTGVDLNRLYFFPRHRNGAEYFASIYAGELFDLASLDSRDPFARVAEEFQKDAGKTTTPDGKALGKWAFQRGGGFEVANLLEQYCDERLRGSASSGVHIECPNDSHHSDAGTPEDHGCFAVNSSDSGYDYFVISCRHASCLGLSGRDMLGKMVRDGWFPAKALFDETFNIAEIEPDAKLEAEVLRAFGQEGEAVSDDDAEFQQIMELIDALPKRSGPAAYTPVIERIRKLKSEFAKALAVKELHTKINKSVPIDMLREMVMTASGGASRDAVRNEKGVLSYKYLGNLDEVDAFDAFFKQAKYWNGLGEGSTRKKSPIITALMEAPRELRHDGEKYRFVELSEAAFRAATTSFFNLSEVDESGLPIRNHYLDPKLSQLIYHSIWGHVPETPELINAPVMMADGTVLNQQGWHYRKPQGPGRAELNIYLDLNGLDVPPVSEAPNDEEVERAVKLLYADTLGEFHFCDEDIDNVVGGKASHANAMALLITPFVRRLFSDCTPLFLTEKPDAGAGGTTLAGIPQRLMYGEAKEPTPYSADESEFRKTLVAAFLEQQFVIALDDVEELNNRALIQSITAKVLAGRILGRNEMAKCPNNFLWIANGISPVIDREIARRICRIRLDVKTDDVQTIVYKKDIEAFVDENRRDLIWAILTLARNWVAKGKVPFKERSLKNFAKWAETVGGILQAAGIKGFLDNPKTPSRGSKDSALADFAAVLYEKRAFCDFKLKDAVTYAIEYESELLDGKNDGAHARAIRLALQKLEYRTFKFYGETVSLQINRDATSEVYSFKLVVKSESGNKGNE